MEKMKLAFRLAAAYAAAALLVLAFACANPPAGLCDAPVRGQTYTNFSAVGKPWSDVEKSPLTPEDDQLCWAAAAANVLHYTGWGLVNGMTTADQIFAYFVDHWTNVGGLMEYAWDWWFDGENDSQGMAGWSQVDVPGGGFYPWCSFSDYYHEQWTASNAMSAIAEYLNSGWGVGLAIYGAGGHAVTCWGYTYDPANPANYYGLWITDSDDDKYLTNPPDRLRYYDVAYSEVMGRWYLQNYFGSNSWYIGGVEALAMIPEPAGLLVLAVGIVGLVARRRNRC